MSDAQIEEAAWAARFTAGVSAYFYGIGYDKERFQEELERIGEYIQSQQE